MPLAGQRVGQATRALAGPAQGRRWIAARGRLDEGIQGRRQAGVGVDQRPSARAGLANPVGGEARGCAQLAEAGGDGISGQSGSQGDGGDAAIAQGQCFGSGPAAAGTLVQFGLQQSVLPPKTLKRLVVDHPDRNTTPKLLKLFMRGSLGRL
jgi:hypothetical protein